MLCLMRCRQQRIAAVAATAAFVALAGAGVPDAARHKLRLSHHADPIRALRHAWGGPRAHAAAITGLPAPWCGTETTTDTPSPLSNAPQIKVIYAYASDQPDRFSSYKDKIQSDVNAIRQRIDTDSGGTRSVRFDLGSVNNTCPNPTTQYVDIQVVHLPKILATYNTAPVFSKLKADLLAALGPLAPGARVNYVVYADKIRALNAAGEADRASDDTHGYANLSNQGPNGDVRLVAFVYGYDD